MKDDLQNKWEGPAYEYGVTWGPLTEHPAYIEKRLVACRPLAAAEYRKGGWYADATAAARGERDTYSSVTRHFPAYDAGSASRDDEVDAALCSSCTNLRDGA